MENNPSLSDKPEVTFPEGNARQDNTCIHQSPPLAFLRPITKIQAKQAQQAPKGEVESVVYYSTKDLNELLFHSGRRLRSMSGSEL